MAVIDLGYGASCRITNTVGVHLAIGRLQSIAQQHTHRAYFVLWLQRILGLCGLFQPTKTPRTQVASWSLLLSYPASCVSHLLCVSPPSHILSHKLLSYCPCSWTDTHIQSTRDLLNFTPDTLATSGPSNLAAQATCRRRWRRCGQPTGSPDP